MKTFEQARRELVELLRFHYRIHDERVLAVMAQVPRHLFIPEEFRENRDADADGDHPCSIGCGQTVSQPYSVAYMTQTLAVQPAEKVLEIGAGSGYQTAVLAALGAEVFTVEIIPQLAEHARTVLAEQGVVNARVPCGDGYRGWPEEALFDGIMVTCGPEEVLAALTEQLAEGGRMMLPVGKWRSIW